MDKRAFRDFIDRHRKWYLSVGKVYCSVLQEYVIFNSKGFYHLKYDGSGKARSMQEQIYRMNLLPSAINVIQKVTTIYEYRRKYISSQKKQTMYWALRAETEKERDLVTVILRKIGNGNITFYSVWKKKFRNKTTKKPPTR